MPSIQHLIIRFTCHSQAPRAVVEVLMDMYSEIGDHIALQYGGSEAHKKVSGASEKGGPREGKHKEFLTSIRRYYSNAFTDRLKQDAINLFLGYFVPREGHTDLWEMDNDYYLHNFHVQAGARNERRRGGDPDSDDEEGGQYVDDEAARKERRKKQRGLIGRGVHKITKKARRSLSPKRDGSISPPPDAQPQTLEAKKKEEMKRRIHARCRRQDAELSEWWKSALQQHLQGQMWMRLGSPKPMPPLFERVYQPGVLTQVRARDEQR